MRMLPNDYLHYALRTVNPSLMFWDEVYGTFEWEEQRRGLAANAALGMCGEAVEILNEPSSDECGDGLWYSSSMCRVLGVDMHWVYDRAFEIGGVSGGVIPSSPAEAERNLIRSAGIIAEQVKKHVFHNKPLAYTVGLSDDLGPDVEGMDEVELEEYINTTNGSMSEDACLRFEKIVEALAMYIHAIEYISPETLEDTMKQNINKLKARWPTGFDV